jgi:hypothetical protein
MKTPPNANSKLRLNDFNGRQSQEWQRAKKKGTNNLTWITTFTRFNGHNSRNRHTVTPTTTITTITTITINHHNHQPSQPSKASHLKDTAPTLVLSASSCRRFSSASRLAISLLSDPSNFLSSSSPAYTLPQHQLWPLTPNLTPRPKSTTQPIRCEIASKKGHTTLLKNGMRL